MSKVLDFDEYTITWVAVLPIEAEAALGMLDKKHDGYFKTVRGDDYIFIGGELNGHKIVVATWLAGQNYSPGAAAALVNQVKARFSNIPSAPHKIPSLHPAYYSAHSTSSSVHDAS